MKKFIPRIWQMHILVIISAIVLSQFDINSEMLLYISLGFSFLYLISIANELTLASKPSKEVGRKKQIASYVSTVIWWPFLIVYILVITYQMVDNPFWESFRYIHWTILIVGTIADLVEFYAMNFIAIESRTSEDFIRQDDVNN